MLIFRLKEVKAKNMMVTQTGDKQDLVNNQQDLSNKSQTFTQSSAPHMKLQTSGFQSTFKTTILLIKHLTNIRL